MFTTFTYIFTIFGWVFLLKLNEISDIFALLLAVIACINLTGHNIVCCVCVCIYFDVLDYIYL